MYLDAIKRGGVAVVTGGASGVGRVAVDRFAKAGLTVVIADLPGDALDAAVADVPGAIGVPTDVSDPEAMAALADRARAAGDIAVLMLNAGVGLRTPCWGEPDNWRKTIAINLFGVQNGVEAFLPAMVEAARPAAVIVTGSKQGITTPPGNPGYNVSKAGVKVLTEMLAHELRQAGVPISAHLFVPGFTYTGMIARFMPEKPPAAWTSEQTVDHMLDRVAAGDFYVLCPDNSVTPDIDAKRVAWAAGDITEGRPALSRWHPDWEAAFKAHEQG